MENNINGEMKAIITNDTTEISGNIKVNVNISANNGNECNNDKKTCCKGKTFIIIFSVINILIWLVVGVFSCKVWCHKEELSKYNLILVIGVLGYVTLIIIASMITSAIVCIKYESNGNKARDKESTNMLIEAYKNVFCSENEKNDKSVTNNVEQDQNK